MDPWLLDPGVLHLNHGSFGARARPVVDEQQRWRVDIERNPVEFVESRYFPALDAARDGLAEFVRADPAGLVFVENATTGVNAVLRSLEPELGPGDQIVETDHGYNACGNAVAVTCDRTGAEVVTAAVPFPSSSPDEVARAILDRVTDRTRLVIVDLVTSPTALVMPVLRLVEQLEPQVPVLVDAAHGPGMLELDLDGLGASFVTGNCHKWLCAPWGAAFLHVRDDWRDRMLPPVVSHGWNTDYGRSRFHALFDWTGTDDPSARLSVPEAIRFGATLHAGGWPGVMEANRRRAIAARDLLADRLALDPAAPDDMLGSMASLVLPGEPPEGGGILDPLTSALRERHRIEVPVFAWQGRRLLRVSAHAYNRLEEYERLGEAVAELL